MWDDHEVRDNWYHAQVLPEQSPYTEKRVAVLAARARQAFLEQLSGHDGARRRRARSIDRFRSGRSSRCSRSTCAATASANNENLQTAAGRRHAFLGARQVRWLADALSAIDARRGRSWPPTCRSASSWRISPAVMKPSPTATTARRSAASSRSRTAEHAESAPRPQRRVDHGRRPLLRRASLRSGARGGQGLRSVLGVRRRPGARGHVRARRARCHVRARGAVQWHAVRICRPNRPPGAGTAILRHARRRSRDRRR